MTSQINGKSAAPPNQTLYVANLPDKLPKDELRYSLYGLFSTYGPVLDVIALKTMKMRGQAHVVFRDVQASSQAMRSLQGFNFFGKEMSISYAKGKANIISRLDGSVKGPEAKTTTATATQATEIQRSVFNNPNALDLAPPPVGSTTTIQSSRSPQGIKRSREDESDENDEVPMEEDDEGEAMEESDDD